MVIRVERRRRIGGVEELLAQRIGRGCSVEALVQEHRPVGHRIVQLFQCREAMLAPQVRMRRADRRNPLALGDGVSVRGQHVLHFANRGRALHVQRVVAGAVGGVEAVEVGVDESRHDRAPAKVDHLRRREAAPMRRRIADRREAAVADGHRARDGVSRVHGVDASVDEHQVGRGSSCGRMRPVAPVAASRATARPAPAAVPRNLTTRDSWESLACGRPRNRSRQIRRIERPDANTPSA